MARPSGSRSVSSHKAHRHNPLSEDLVATGPLREKSKKRKSQLEEEDDRYVDSRSSRKILKIGRDLVNEANEGHITEALNPAFTFESRFAHGDEPAELGQLDDEDAWGDEEEDVIEEVEIDPHDISLFNKFMPTTTSQDHILEPTIAQTEDADGQGRNLAEIILEKIAAHEATRSGQPVIHGGGPAEEAVELPAKVVEVYSKIGLILSRYKSGKLPKPFKIIPTLPQWQELLFITRPEAWTPNACYEATRIFSSAKPHISQQFLEIVILDRVREDIHETRKLNVHLYNALKKATYRPAAFFKGFLFPLVSSGTCTLREAHILSSVLAKISIPVLHSAAALLRLTEIAAEQSSVATESAGATNIFIRILLEKKYALPYKVIDGLVFHFLRFRAAPQMDQMNNSDNDAGVGSNSFKLPVLWHQCLLAFAQRYRNDITEDQREALLDLLLSRGHKDIGPEVRRELLAGRGRGVVIEEQGGDGGDDTMMRKLAASTLESARLLPSLSDIMTMKNIYVEIQRLRSLERSEEGIPASHLDNTNAMLQETPTAEARALPFSRQPGSMSIIKGLVTTKEGFIGGAPPLTRTVDEVFLLPGGKVPFILRLDGVGKWRLVGSHIFLE